MTVPTWQQLLRTLESEIASGTLQPGQPAPSQRAAARRWGVSVATVTRVYAEATRRGWLHARVGSGTVVARPAAPSSPPPAAGLHDLAMNAPRVPRHLNASALLRDAFARLANGRAHALLDRAGQASEAPQHVEAAAQWLSTLGIDAQSCRTFVTPGAQAGLLVALRSAVGEGGGMACEPLVNPGLVAAAAFVGARLLPVAVDAEGPKPEAVEALAVTRGLRALYASPSCSNPLALHWSARRRQALAAVAEKHDLWVIEDDDLLPMDPATLPLCALAPERTLLIVGLSKLAGFALRTGFVHVPRALVDGYRRHLRAAVWMASPVLAEIAAHWLGTGLMDELVQARRQDAMQHQAIAAALLGGHGYRAPAFGTHGWLPLAKPWDAERFAFHARRHGVAVAPDGEFRLAGVRGWAGVRLALSSTASSAELREALEALAHLLAHGPKTG